MRPRKHPIGDRGDELVVGLVLFGVGAWLVWDSYEGRGRKTPWPLSIIAPW